MFIMSKCWTCFAVLLISVFSRGRDQHKHQDPGQQCRRTGSGGSQNTQWWHPGGVKKRYSFCVAQVQYMYLWVTVNTIN